MYSIPNEGISPFAERFIRTLKNKIYKFITSVSKNKYNDILDDIVNKYNTYRTIKMKPVDLKPSIYSHGHVVSDLNTKVIVGSFYEKELQKTN